MTIRNPAAILSSTTQGDANPSPAAVEAGASSAENSTPATTSSKDRGGNDPNSEDKSGSTCCHGCCNNSGHFCMDIICCPLYCLAAIF
mmetsp:Transcript_10564/g.29161  ORF Transcript_10564/g.29161 Transcript_10564/m.29161 type:complete len:88 (+) Transcript_10564:183-446(+)